MIISHPLFLAYLREFGFQRRARSIKKNNAGVRVNVNIKLANIPPIITAPIATFIPSIDHNCGTIPAITAIDVIKTIFFLSINSAHSAVCISSPEFTRFIVGSNTRMLLLTTKPTSITNANIAPIFIVAPDKNINTNTPIKLVKIDVAIVNGCAKEFKIAANNIKVNIVANKKALPILVCCLP